MKRALEIKGTMQDVRSFGICEYEENAKVEEFNEQTYHNQVIAMEVDSFNHIPSGMIKKTIDGGRYAVFTHRGKIDLIKETYNYIWGTWVPYSKVELDFRDEFELYDEGFKGRQNPSSTFDIYIPIK
ncbi:GyrI-like small molecule binding domain-containing protein [Natronincola peptidivorans]|uniref:GyrI-like small molecule binding domain-containing protein n=2 Tax=Natronincola peptidivorans TaxID=426128 RepID=A0A1I0B2W6_9FIRM|nr:GyrI-like small molecule binding domain-containing protein [Natronincola peptidivorans]